MLSKISSSSGVKMGHLTCFLTFFFSFRSYKAIVANMGSMSISNLDVKEEKEICKFMMGKKVKCRFYSYAQNILYSCKLQSWQEGTDSPALNDDMLNWAIKKEKKKGQAVCCQTTTSWEINTDIWQLYELQRNKYCMCADREKKQREGGIKILWKGTAPQTTAPPW